MVVWIVCTTHIYYELHQYYLKTKRDKTTINKLFMEMEQELIEGVMETNVTEIFKIFKARAN